MEEENRLVSGYKTNEDENELSLRPQSLSEYIGQYQVKSNLKVFIEAAKTRSEALDHVLLYGPPGLGKTTLAHVIANEMEGRIKLVSGPTIEKNGDLAAILSSLDAGDILFIDEIHRLPRVIEELLYSAMEDYQISIVIGKDSSARAITLDLPPFTLVGATTRQGSLSSPLRDRFGIVSRLEYYTIEELKQIIKRTGKVFETSIDEDAVNEIANRSRGTPRVANRLFKRIRDFATVKNNGIISQSVAIDSLIALQVDSLGLDLIDIKYLNGIVERFNGGPVGLEAIAAAIGEEVMNIEDMCEPFLLQIGLINRTPRGRQATQKAYEHLNVSYQNRLF